jgi:hypothetical protein
VSLLAAICACGRVATGPFVRLSALGRVRRGGGGREVGPQPPALGQRPDLGAASPGCALRWRTRRGSRAHPVSVSGSVRGRVRGPPDVKRIGALGGHRQAERRHDRAVAASDRVTLGPPAIAERAAAAGTGGDGVADPPQTRSKPEDTPAC